MILGATGRNFAAGMSGGIAYVLDEQGDFASRCNTEMVGLEQLDGDDAAALRAMIEKHAEKTGSSRAANILTNWDGILPTVCKGHADGLQTGAAGAGAG